MAKYIEKSEAIIIADYAVDEHPYDKDPERPETYSDYNQGWNDACDYIRGKLETMPVTDGVPVRRGRWDGDTCTSCNLPWNYNMTQNAQDWGYFDPMPDYCPNCGAKMDLEGSK